MKIVLSILSCLVFSLAVCPRVFAADVNSAPETVPSDASDEFAQIGKQKHAEPNGVPEGEPLDVITNVLFPWDPRPAAGFADDKIDTQEELNGELKRMRKRYAPFMADLAPAIPARPEIKLEKFAWRLATDADRADIHHALEGKGEWKQVSIPHYDGPINDAVSYYRTTVNATADLLKSGTPYIHFQGADYIAEVYCNGKLLGSHEGLFDPFEFNLEECLKPGKNVLVVKLTNQPVHMGEFFNVTSTRQFGKKFAACGGPGWNNPPVIKNGEQTLGWTMCPPGFGLWQRAWLEFRPKAFVSDIFVAPVPERHEARVSVEVTRTDPAAPALPAADLRYSLYGQNFKLTLAQGQSLPAGVQAKELSPGVSLYQFTVPMPGAQLRWWSHEEPWLYQIQVSLIDGSRVTDVRKRQFGVKTFTQDRQASLKGRFHFNGKEIKLRGANMMGNLMNCVMKGDFDQLRDDILLAKIANMNFWRMTQQPCQEEVYDYFDRLGMLAQTDMPVFNGIRNDQAGEAMRELKAMVRLVRSHACNGVITYINEPDFGKPHMLNMGSHRALLRAFDVAALELNPTQVIKWIEGDYPGVTEGTGYRDHHDYGGWYSELGGRYWAGPGVNAGWMQAVGEFGAEGLDSVTLMKKYYPKEWLETKPDGTWTPERIFRNQQIVAGKNWFGLPRVTMEEYVRISRNHQYWVVRLMAESMRRNPKINSFAVHLLIDAWPNGWMKAIMDYDRQAKPAYFAYRDALTPLAVSLRPGQSFLFSGESLIVQAWICNDTPEAPTGTTLRYQVKLGDKVLATGSTPSQVFASGPKFQGTLKLPSPAVDKAQPLTVDVGLFDAGGKLLHSSSVDIDLLPAAYRDPKNRPKDLPPIGGALRRLIGK